MAATPLNANEKWKLEDCIDLSDLSKYRSIIGGT